MIETLRKLEKEGNFFNLMKIYKNPTADTVLNSERQLIPFRIRNKTRMSALTTSFSTVLEVLAGAFKQEKKPLLERKK